MHGNTRIDYAVTNREDKSSPEANNGLAAATVELEGVDIES